MTIHWMMTMLISIQKTTIKSWLIFKKYVLCFLGSLSFKDIWTMIELFPIHFFG